MDSIYRCCCGLDVHKDTVAACLRKIGDDGKIHIEKRTYSTMTKDLLLLSDWMRSEQAVRECKIAKIQTLLYKDL